MARKAQRKALGRGLSALLGDQQVGAAEQSSTNQTGPNMKVPVDLIDANPNQPRKTLHDADLDDLASSLRRHGLVQPVLLRPSPTTPGRFQIVAGERRWRAAQRAEIHEMPAVIRELDDREILELAMIENIQRVDLDPIEEAEGFRNLIDTFGYTQAELADVIGKSRSHLANMMRLLALPPQVIEMVRNGKLSAGHARALINAADPIALAQQAVLRQLTVRQVEQMAKIAPESKGTRKTKSVNQKDSDTRILEGDLTASIKMRVLVNHSSDGGGEVVIRYKTLEDLDRLCQKLTE